MNRAKGQLGVKLQRGNEIAGFEDLPRMGIKALPQLVNSIDLQRAAGGLAVAAEANKQIRRGLQRLQ